MPELPEVEVIRRGLAPLVTGRRICLATLGGKRLRLSPSGRVLTEQVQGRTIAGIGRRAKFLLIVLADGVVLCVHLGMSGRLGLFSAETPVARHDHLRLLLDNGMEIRFNDPRRFGSLQLFGSTGEAAFASLGPEPFGEEFRADYLLTRAAGRRLPVKNFLMDNRVVVGIGNIYASETLFAAGISPLTPAGVLGREAWQGIVEQARRILARAIEAGGTTIADFVDHRGEKGLFQLSLAVYGRAGLPCPTCAATIEKVVLAGRSSFYCPVCQK